RLRDRRRLVLSEADAVPGAVHEVWPVARLLDGPPGSQVHLVDRYPWANHRQGIADSGFDSAVDVPVSGRWLSQRRHPRDVRAISIDLAAQIEQHRFAGLGAPRAGVMVRKRAVGPRPHDG